MHNAQTRGLWSVGAIALVTLGVVLAGTLVGTPTLQADAAAQASPLATATAGAAAKNAAAESTADATEEEVERPEGWSEASHGDVDPDYAVVFPDDQVNQITITIDPDSWAAMQEDLTNLLGEQGTGGGFPGGQGGGFPGGGFPGGERPEPPAGMEPPEGMEFPEGAEPPADGADVLIQGAPGARPQGGPGGMGGGDFTTENPMWVSATVEFDGQTWSDVGVRYKGNSSLSSGWRSGTLSLPFKLDFDEWEDENPAIADQRFYGFKQLSLSNNFGDSSLMRETLAYDLLEEAGLPAAQTASYEVILDYGEGPVSLGLYTMVEVIDDTVIDRFFGDDSGNIYEGDGSGVSLAEGTFDQIESSFLKENNEDAADWSDIEALYTVLHSETRTTDPEAWRAELEELFDVDSFLEWLAISAVIGHWDTYGGMSHNFYVYNNDGQLSWISWDHNFTFQSGGMGAGGMRPAGAASGAADPAAPIAPAQGSAAGDAAEDDAAAENAAEESAAGNAPAAGGNAGGVFQPRGGRGGPGGRSTSLDKADVNESWPLIRFLLDDPTYYEAYVGYMQELMETAFDSGLLEERIDQYAELLAPYAAEQTSEVEYNQAVEQLRTFVESRTEAVQTFLETQE